MKREVILVVGANGQIGSALLPMLQNIYGLNNVIAADLSFSGKTEGIYEKLDAGDPRLLEEIIKKYSVTQIYHLAAILSAKGEADPIWTWNLNMQTLLNVLEAARKFKLDKVFIPSSIAVFGNSAPAYNTPQKVYLDPSTIYGVSKVAAENWIYYYYHRYNMDIRSLRYPGVISYQSVPGGGTTDYAVDMYHKAASDEECTCFLSSNTRLPMIYINDALRAALELMEAAADRVKIRSSYNLAGLSFTPGELYDSIKEHIPGFRCNYAPDFRQSIADSWPRSIDDSSAREDWGWKPEFDLPMITKEMLDRMSVIHP